MREILSSARVGLIEMASDWKRFWLLIVCLAVGTALIAGVSSVSSAITRAVDQNAAVLMGGDLELVRADRPATDDELAIIGKFGSVATMVETNLTARSPTTDAFVDMVAVGPSYPLIGEITTSQAGAATHPFDALSEQDGAFGVLADPVMLDQLGLSVGDVMSIGGTDFTVRGTLSALPDGPVRGSGLGSSRLSAPMALPWSRTARRPCPGSAPISATSSSSPSTTSRAHGRS